MTQLTANFTLEEFEHSDVAVRHGIPNTIPKSLLPAISATAEMMQRIRDFLGQPIIVSSGYRSEAVNRAVGGAGLSDHLTARACDFRCPGFGDPVLVALALAPHVSTLGIGQLIAEFGRAGWVHVSTRVPDNPANRIITIDRQGTRVGVHDAR